MIDDTNNLLADDLESPSTQCMTEDQRSSALSNLRVDVSALLIDFDINSEDNNLSGAPNSTFVRCKTFTGCSRKSNDFGFDMLTKK